MAEGSGTTAAGAGAQAPNPSPPSPRGGQDAPGGGAKPQAGPDYQRHLMESNAWKRMTRSLEIEYGEDRMDFAGDLAPESVASLAHTASTILGYKGFVVNHAAFPKLVITVKPAKGA